MPRAQLEIGQGAAFRAEALRPIQREKPLSAARGRILARDGTVLACDRQVAAVAVDYRWLEDPPRRAWLEQQARQRLPRDQRRNSVRLAEEVEKLRQQRDDLHRRLAAFCGVDAVQWQARMRRVQERVERIAADTRRRQLEAVLAVPSPPDNASWPDRLSAALRDIFGLAHDALPAVVTVAEELSEHVLAEDIPAPAAAEIQAHAEQYPGTQIVQVTRRAYPHGCCRGESAGLCWAASSTPHAPREEIRHAERDEYVVGVTGVEQQCEAQLCGQPGMAIETENHAGRVEQTAVQRKAVPGNDVTLTIDPRLQETAENLLDSAVRRTAMQYHSAKPTGGAIVVLDVRNGEVLVAASAPRFDPAVFAGDDSFRRAALLADEGHPLFHRAIQMALPPGSVFKTLTAVALLESAGLDPAATFYCRGYLKRPDQQRCAIYVRHGVGHGNVTLADALAQSCNVYFSHHAQSLPPEALVDWSRRFGFGQATGIDLPGEARGILPSPETIEKLQGHRWQTADTQAMAVGQGALTATPLQIARMMAAVANGGLLVMPHVVSHAGRTSGSVSGPAPQPIPGLTYSTLAAVRAGLSRTVADKQGTAHDALYLEQVAIAGKTGTAEISDDRPEHAWFAGYVPAEKPRYAIVIVLERAGNSSTAACPLTKRLVLKMIEAGML